MVHLDLTREDVEVLVEMLESLLSDLRMEISDTDNKDFRDMLKGRKAILMKALQELQEGMEGSDS